MLVQYTPIKVTGKEIINNRIELFNLSINSCKSTEEILLWWMIERF